MNRPERHAAILRLVREHPISTQTELADALRSEGHEVVQTTVSRDVHELGLVKVRHETGRLVYAFPEDVGLGEDVSAAISRWALTVEPSALAQAIDVSRYTRIAGTVAGENTVLLVAREPFTGAEVAEEINRHRLEGAA